MRYVCTLSLLVLGILGWGLPSAYHPYHLLLNDDQVKLVRSNLMHLKFCSGFEKLSKTVKRPQTFLSKVSLNFPET